MAKFAREPLLTVAFFIKMEKGLVDRDSRLV